jgi:ammonia channel protein AmtB
LRASADEEAVGLDISNHGEEAYVHGEASQMHAGAGVK